VKCGALWEGNNGFIRGRFLYALQQGEEMNEFGAIMGEMQAQINANPNMTEAEQTVMMMQAMG